jgi:hypothetical protein
MSHSTWNPAFDVQHTAPNWDADLAFGQEGEQIVTEFLSAINQRRFEVKYDRYRNGRMVVETAQNPRNEGWKPSGINVTEADWWVYMFSPGAFLMVPVPRLKRWLRGRAATMQKRRFAENSNNPAEGFLLFPHDVQDLMNNPEWD